MKNLINVCVVSLAVMLSSLMLALPAPALQGLTGIDALMGVPCITNWIRVAPHQCFATVFPSPVALVTDGVCRALDLTTLALDSAQVAITSADGVILLPPLKGAGDGFREPFDLNRASSRRLNKV